MNLDIEGKYFLIKTRKDNTFYRVGQLQCVPMYIAKKHFKERKFLPFIENEVLVMFENGLSIFEPFDEDFMSKYLLFSISDGQTIHPKTLHIGEQYFFKRWELPLPGQTDRLTSFRLGTVIEEKRCNCDFEKNSNKTNIVTAMSHIGYEKPFRIGKPFLRFHQIKETIISETPFEIDK